VVGDFIFQLWRELEETRCRSGNGFGVESLSRYDRVGSWIYSLHTRIFLRSEEVVKDMFAGWSAQSHVEIK
jgi:hypothetical protein